MVFCSERQEGFHDLMISVAGGSDDAFRQLLELYGDYVIRTIRRVLDRKLRSRFDSQDFEQSIWLELHRRRHVLCQCVSPESLIELLAAIARQKVVGEYRRHMDSEKFNLNGLCPVDVQQFRSAIRDRRVATNSQD